MSSQMSSQMSSKIPLSIKKALIYGLYSQDGVDGGIRTPDRALRRRMLYPAELRRQRIYFIT